MKLNDCSLKPTTGLKAPPQILFRKCSDRKRCSKILKVPYYLNNTVPFSLTLQACCPEFLTSSKTDSTKKMDSYQRSDIVGNLSEKDL